MKYVTISKLTFMACALGLANLSFAEDMQQQPHTAVHTAATQASMTPQQALQSLKDGNQRFVSGNMKNRDLMAQASSTAIKQHPVIVVLNCIDSRTPPEIVFDQGIGDMFAARIAGNIQNADILGSMEFGTQVAGAKLIAVIGHTSCGAVRGACNKVKLGNLTGLLQKIQPAVQQAAKKNGKVDCASDEFVDEVAVDNVLLVMKQIQANSPVLNKLLKNGKIGLVGGIQDLSTGKVTFFEDKSVMPKA